MDFLKIIFVISLIMMLADSIILIKTMKTVSNAETDKSKKFNFFKPIPYNFKTLFVFAGILFFLVLSIIARNTPYADGFILMTVTLIAEYILACLYRANNKKLLKFSAKTLIALSILELTIFNFPAYHIWFGNYQQKTLSLSEANIEIGKAYINNQMDSIIYTGKEEVVLTFYDINTEIGTIYADINFKGDTNRIKTVVDITDETSATYRYDIVETNILKEREMSEYMTCDFSGEIRDLRIKFTGYNESDNITIKNITFNKMIPFEISYLRLFLIGGLSVMIYAICCLESFREPVYKRKCLCRNFFIFTTAICCIISVIIIDFNIGSNSSMSDQFKLDSGNQITEELVEAFENGQVHLLEEPSDSILNLENPYDRNSRESQGIYPAWDHVLYEGKYYSYYGIAPVILLFLPYHMITGYYFSTAMAILIFSVIGIIFLTMTYSAFINKFYNNISSGIAITGHIILLATCGIWYSIGRNIFYEISISSGFMFTVMGAYFLLSSNAVGNGKISAIKTFLSALFLSLSVLCRPTLAVYCICACVYFAYGFFKKENPMSENSSGSMKRNVFLMSAIVPFVVLGGFQMWYNYVRFDSPLDFGIQYSLTINDFIHSQYHTIFVFISLFNYLFAVPSFYPEYPFVKTEFSHLGANGFFFNDEGNTSGILFLALPVFAYIFAVKALKKLPDRKSKIKSILLVGLPCVIMPLVIICSVWESGYAVRYTADFSWQIIIGAYAILFFLYSQSKNNTKKDFIQKFMAFSMVYALIVNGIQIFIFTFDEYNCAVFGKEYYPEICWSMEHLLTFWK